MEIDEAAVDHAVEEQQRHGPRAVRGGEAPHDEGIVVPEDAGKERQVAFERAGTGKAAEGGEFQGRSPRSRAVLAIVCRPAPRTMRVPAAPRKKSGRKRKKGLHF